MPWRVTCLPLLNYTLVAKDPQRRGLKASQPIVELAANSPERLQYGRLQSGRLQFAGHQFRNWPPTHLGGYSLGGATVWGQRFLERTDNSHGTRQDKTRAVGSHEITMALSKTY